MITSPKGSAPTNQINLKTASGMIPSPSSGRRDQNTPGSNVSDSNLLLNRQLHKQAHHTLAQMPSRTSQDRQPSTKNSLKRKKDGKERKRKGSDQQHRAKAFGKDGGPGANFERSGLGSRVGSRGSQNLGTIRSRLS